MIFTFLVLLCCSTFKVWAAPGVHKNGADIPTVSIANIQDGPVPSDRTSFDSEYQPATRSTPPIHHIPSLNCTPSDNTFAQQQAETSIDYFCNKEGVWWNYAFAPPISLGLNYTSDGRKKVAAAGAGRSISKTSSVWTGLWFSRDSCSGFFPFTLGNTDDEKEDHCKKRFRAILNGCGSDKSTMKKEGMLVDGCRVYQIAVAAKNPFTVDELYGDRGDLVCKDNEKSLKGTCICNYARYPGLTDVFERPVSKSCEARDVDLTKLAID